MPAAVRRAERGARARQCSSVALASSGFAPSVGEAAVAAQLEHEGECKPCPLGLVRGWHPAAGGRPGGGSEAGLPRGGGAAAGAAVRLSAVVRPHCLPPLLAGRLRPPKTGALPPSAGDEDRETEVASLPGP